MSLYKANSVPTRRKGKGNLSVSVLYVKEQYILGRGEDKDFQSAGGGEANIAKQTNTFEHSPSCNSNSGEYIANLIGHILSSHSQQTCPQSQSGTIQKYSHSQSIEEKQACGLRWGYNPDSYPGEIANILQIVIAIWLSFTVLLTAHPLLHLVLLGYVHSLGCLQLNTHLIYSLI